MFGVHLPYLEMPRLFAQATNVSLNLANHHCRHIYTDYAATRADMPRRRKEYGPSAGGHIEHCRIGRGSCPFNKPLTEMGKDLRADAVVGGRCAAEHPDNSRLPIIVLRFHSRDLPSTTESIFSVGFH